MSPESVAVGHYRARQRLATAAAASGREAWTQVDGADLDGSWPRPAARLLVVLTGAQLAAAQAADGYVDTVLAEQGVADTSGGRVAAEALAGVASDGRELATLLLSPVVAVKLAVGRGATPARALASGYATLDMIIRTQVADAGRVADQIALTARPAAQGYTRMVVGASCARCVILAGRFYRWNAGFARHPRCDCVHVPSRETLAGGLRTNPKRYFGSLSAAEQDRVFGKAGAEAIRDGADPARVVNARRGMFTVGGRRLTREATTRRGGVRRARLMPEQIFREANGNRTEAIRQLRLHGYLT